MNNKSEIESSAIIYVLVVVIIAFALLFSFGGIKSIKNVEKKVEINSFVDTLQNSINAQKSKGFGSVTPLTLSMPSGIDTICFIDEKERFSPQSFLELTNEKHIYNDRNLFFFPSGKFDPAKINNIKLNQSDNPLCVNAVNSKINIKLTTLANSTFVEAANPQESSKDCVIVAGSNVGNPDNKADIVFLGYGYNNKTVFASDVDDYVQNYFFKTEPFLSNKDKFNVWMVDEGQIKCSITNYVSCDSFSVNKLASNCPNDYIFILVDPRLLKISVRSSAISNMAKINTRDNNLVLLHEFGHIFANLADEYTDSYYSSWFDSNNYPNCDNNGCSKWSSVEGTSCLKGCSTNDFYRSVDVSIMRDYDKSASYGILNEKTIKRNLGEYR
jgi:hypothetical protein